LRREQCIGLLLVSLAALTVVGCGSKTPKAASGSTAQETALAFGKALQQGKAELAAAYWAYDAEARKQNEDWSSIPAGQRSEIIGKVREERIAALKSLMPTLQGTKGDLEAAAQGDTVALSAGGAPLLVVTCVKSSGGYQVLAADRPGQPVTR
jgi:hypothetical protein